MLSFIRAGLAAALVAFAPFSAGAADKPFQDQRLSDSAVTLEAQIKAMSASVKADSGYAQSPQSSQNAIITGSPLPPFDTGLYHVSCAVEVRAGDKLDILYRVPVNHSALDCFCLYYVEDERRPWLMRPRFGSTFYVPVTPQQMVGGVYTELGRRRPTAGPRPEKSPDPLCIEGRELV